MAITTLSIYQDNKTGDSDLMPIHSPLVFLVDADYTGGAPATIHCEIYDSVSVLKGTFKCVPYQDISTSTRRFMFIAQRVLKSYMGEFQDFAQSDGTLVYVDDITKVFRLVFVDPDAVAGDVETTITAIHGVSQFGSDPNFPDIYNNVTEVVTGIKDKPCYVYFYNEDESNILAVDQQSYVKFVVQNGGVIDLAKIRFPATGDSGENVEYTNIFGEATYYDLSAGTYQVIVAKYAYALYTDNITVIEDAAMVVDVTMTAKNSVVTTFEVYDTDTVTPLSGIGLEITWNNEPVDTGTTNGSGQYVSNLYDYQTGQTLHVIEVTDTLTFFETLRSFPALINPSLTAPTQTVVIDAILDTVIVTLHVETTGGTPISGATIGDFDYVFSNDPTAYLPWESALLTTNGSGDATWITRKSFARNIGIKASGYTSRIKSAVVSTTNITIDIEMT